MTAMSKADRRPLGGPSPWSSSKTGLRPQLREDFPPIDLPVLRLWKVLTLNIRTGVERFEHTVLTDRH